MAYYLKKMEKELSASGISVQNHDVVAPPFTESCPPHQKDQDKRIRREIANSNERRRMQSINTGFQSLRTLLPNHDGEKLSKAAILQQTGDYIYRLEHEKTQLLNQVVTLKKLLKKYEKMEDGDAPSPKRRKRVDSMMDEGIGSPESLEDAIPSGKTHDDIRRDVVELRCQLDRERQYRMMLQEQNRSLEAQLYPEKLKELAKQIQIQEQQQQQHHAYEERKRGIEVAAIPQQHPLLLQYQIPPQAPPVITPTTSTTSRQNLETIVQAIRHLEGDKPTPGNTPVQTPSHTPTPDDEARKYREDTEVIVATPIERPQIVSTPVERLQFVSTPSVSTPIERPQIVSTPIERPQIVSTPIERPQIVSTPIERSLVCQRVDIGTNEADKEVDHYTSQQQRLHVELVHPVGRLTTCPLTSPITARPTPPPRPSIIVS